MPKIGPTPSPLAQKQALPLNTPQPCSMHKLGPVGTALVPKQAQPLKSSKEQHQAEQAADQFETMMAQQLVKSMQSSLDGGSLFGGGVSGDIYSGLAEWQLAQVLTKGAHFGFKEQILRQLPKAEVQK